MTTRDVLYAMLTLALCASCGRLGFDEIGGGGARDATPVSDGENGDSGPPTGADGRPCDPGACGSTRRVEITIDQSRLQSVVTDVPVLITVDPATIDYRETQADGADLRFYNRDLDTELAYEIEGWNPGGESSIWVRIPELVPDPVEPLALWLYYGNPTAPAGQDPAGVWSNGFVSVHHLGGDFADSTAAGRHGTSTAPPDSAAGRIGVGYSFNGSTQYIELPDESAYDFTLELSASVWFQVASFNRVWQAMVTKGDHTWRLHRAGSTEQLGFGSTDQSSLHHSLGGSLAVDDGNWHHALITYDGTRKTLYVDGQIDGDIAYSSTLDSDNYPVYIGENAELTNRFFDGRLDEVRISATPRSQDWARVEYLSVSDPTFITMGLEEQL